MQKTANFSATALKRLAQEDVRRALAEDLGADDATAAQDLTASLIAPERSVRARIVARESAIVCGSAWVQAAVLALDADAQITWHVPEGQRCAADQVVCELQGNARALLTAERTALNFLQLLSGVASKTAQFVEAVQGSRAQIVDTRKTLPGLRLAQKYAVHCGGGTNHRIGLYDAILIKENHIAAAGGIAQVLAQVARQAAQAQFIEIEVENLAQLDEALQHGAKMVLLDNMNLPTLSQAVALNAGRAVLEISGGVRLESLRALAATGVDRISIGTLTKDVRATDYSMRFDALL
jgi:nicotinate-nucleotide pyrophosphorylase (carboxylating)